MAIERKLFKEKTEKKSVEKQLLKKVKRGFNPEKLQDAIVENKLVVSIESEIVVNRFRNGKESYHVCTIKRIDESGLIHTWDETIQQWFTFSINDHPKTVKILN